MLFNNIKLKTHKNNNKKLLLRRILCLVLSFSVILSSTTSIAYARNGYKPKKERKQHKIYYIDYNTDDNDKQSDEPTTPAEPIVTEPAPTEPTPIVPTPVEPAPTEPTPVVPTPVEPTPTPTTPPTEINKNIAVPVLMYHKVTDTEAQITEPEMQVTKDNLRKQLLTLKGLGYKTISLNDLYNYMKGNLAIPEKSIVLTFDDGYNAEGLIEVLKELDMHADISLVTNRAAITENSYDPNDYFAYDAAKQFATLKNSNGDNMFSFASHTVNHPDLTTLSSAQLDNELISSANVIKETFGNTSLYGDAPESDILVYPYGVYNQAVENEAIKDGYKMGVLIDEGLNVFGGDVMEIKRITVCNDYTGEYIESKIESLAK